MRSTDITVFYSTLRTGALERILKEQGKSLDSAVEEMLDDLYQRIVPEQERTEIEARIRQEEAQTAAETEAARRFAVYRIQELGEDSYFTSEAHNDLYLAACECRAYLQDPKPFLLPDYETKDEDDDEPCMCPACQELMRNRAASAGAVLPSEELEE